MLRSHTGSHNVSFPPHLVYKPFLLLQVHQISAHISSHSPQVAATCPPTCSPRICEWEYVQYEGNMRTQKGLSGKTPRHNDNDPPHQVWLKKKVTKKSSECSSIPVFLWFRHKTWRWVCMLVLLWGIKRSNGFSSYLGWVQCLDLDPPCLTAFIWGQHPQWVHSCRVTLCVCCLNALFLPVNTSSEKTGALLWQFSRIGITGLIALTWPVPGDCQWAPLHLHCLCGGRDANLFKKLLCYTPLNTGFVCMLL